MGNTKNTGGPAFPGNGEQFVEGPHGLQPQGAYGMQGSEGMTLRDYFAAKAMPMLMQEWPINIFDNDAQDEVARNCYRMADAMLNAREQ